MNRYYFDNCQCFYSYEGICTEQEIKNEGCDGLWCGSCKTLDAREVTLKAEKKDEE